MQFVPLLVWCIPGGGDLLECVLVLYKKTFLYDGKTTAVDCHCPILLQGTFPNQGSNLHLLCLLALAGGFFTCWATWEAMYFIHSGYTWASPIGASLVAQRIKCLPAMQETRVQSLGQEDPLEKEMATHSSILAWKIPWTEKPSKLQSMGSQRVGHDWATSLSISLSPKAQQVKSPPAIQELQRQGFSVWVGKIPWRRKWLPTPHNLNGTLDSISLKKMVNTAFNSIIRRWKR